MAIEKYVIVSTDITDKVIKGGPLLWDGTSSLKVDAGLQLITMNAANQGGYTRPAAPATELNAATLRERITVALPAIAAYPALPTPSAAQTTAQVQRLTRLITALAKLLLDQTDTTDGT